MKQNKTKIAGITAALASTTLMAATASADSYTVVAGDNLYRLAIQFNTTVDAIAQANGISNPHWIYVNQQLTIPSGSSSGSTGSDDKGSTDSSGGYHYVVQGDTLSQLAMTYGTTVEQLATWNNISNVNFIRVGWTLKVSESASAGNTGSTATPTQYTVVKGDNLWDLSMKYGTTVRQLAAWNNIPNIHLIYVGQVLTVSGTGTNTAGAVYGDEYGEITKDMTPDAVSYEEWLEAMAEYSQSALESQEAVEEAVQEAVTPETPEETVDMVEGEVIDVEIPEETVAQSTESALVEVSVDSTTADLLEAEYGDVVELPESSLAPQEEITYDYSEPVEEEAPVVEEEVVRNTYTVLEDTTLFQISALFNASVGDLIAWNEVEDTNHIPAGTVLRISE